MLGSPGTVRRFLTDEASAAPNPRNAESNKNETKKIDKKMIKGIIAFFTACRMMVVPCKSHRGKVSNRQSNCRRAPWYRLYMWRVLVLKVGPRASFLEDLVGLREKSTVHFPPKNVVDTQYVLGCNKQKQCFKSMPKARRRTAQSVRHLLFSGVVYVRN